MLDERRIKTLEAQLNSLAEVYRETRNRETKERNRGYCQGIAFALEQFGYSVTWDNGKATVFKDV